MSKKKTKKKARRKAPRRKAASEHGRRGRASAPRPEGDTPHFPLDELKLDAKNARLGQGPRGGDQRSLLNALVDDFGIDDLLSSIAVNGYFTAEPLVGVRESDGIAIIEGNRRLAACLILAGDPRAEDQARRTRHFQLIMEEHATEAPTELPVLVHQEEERARLLPYLGVRHIAASQPWDSYAKAAWVAAVLDDSDLTLSTISEMIGDQHRTVVRMVTGYRFAQQVIDAGAYNPKNSMRRGRGSNTDYPFSWIYTALGYQGIREWLGLESNTESPPENPLKPDRVAAGGELMLFMFGDSERARNPVVDESREISDLSQVVGDPALRRQLLRGTAVTDVVDMARPAVERAIDNLLDANESLRGVLEPLAQGEIGREDARELAKPSKRVRALSADIDDKISDLQG